MRDLTIALISALLGAFVIFLTKLPVAEITKVILANPAAGVAAVAAIFALISGVLGPFVQWRVGRRQGLASQLSAKASMLAAEIAGAREVAKLRMAWMEKLRDTLSEYHAILMSTEDGGELLPDDTRTLSRLGTQIDLLLNRKDQLQRRLWEIADKIYKLDTQAERQALDEDLVQAGRDVLKAEWEKVKREMRGEGFQTGETQIVGNA
ncbi:hypothetical protein [Bradyrhizobium sp. URHD0069]|uniref:hypothetical protein n=1 Tax=Bradyrhizobium sp. URHD0069 TaxID=1380355 RepID=UPI00049709B8|nr:hypothetical protein [Bradyrhizobium sp. URHD0069]